MPLCCIDNELKEIRWLCLCPIKDSKDDDKDDDEDNDNVVYDKYVCRVSGCLLLLLVSMLGVGISYDVAVAFIDR